MKEQIETVIIGGGQAGLAMSYVLTQLGQEHVVLERGRLVERWQSERWDSLTLLTPNWMTGLPGYHYAGAEPDGFLARDDVVRWFHNYAVLFRPAVRYGVAVTSLDPESGAASYCIRAEQLSIECKNVVIATGPYQGPSVPAVSGALPQGLFQVHSAHYRNPLQLPAGAVLVVGSGTSGCQIAEELLAARRVVYLSVGRHFPVPRRYRGRDYFVWRRDMGLLDQSSDEVPALAGTTGPTPILTGLHGGHDLSPARLARQGGVLVGHLQGAHGARLILTPDLEQQLAAGEAAAVRFKEQVDEYVRTEGIDAPAEPPPSDEGSPGWGNGEPSQELDLGAAQIRSVVWATGFRYDFGWVHLPVFDSRGAPIHRRGVSGCRGVYFLGLPWLHTRKSSFIGGVGDDAWYIGHHMSASR